ncbi:hypothetical protein C8F04DRAFT_414754 [Mycena alexandri]|uniref:Uncharacterized protein n=1 Tax=Mycena alexandri TaxID=1745969 RepID=A0AAD6T1D1_9AGAR|nr:hypothetical protein C8F04DRAFT_414754 [Mycena alexandri]
MKFSATFVTLCFIAVRVQAHKLPSLYSLQRRGDQFVTGPCTQDSDCQQGCCGFTSGKCAGPAVAQTNGSGGCGFGTKTPNCNVAAALGLSDCIAGAKNGDLADPGVQAAAAFAAKLDNLPFTPKTASTAAPPAAADPASTAAAPPPAAADSGDLQQSLTVDASVLQTTDDGQNPPVTGQAAAQTSKNNFINFCVPTLKNLPITNGLQITTGSCNPTPIGQIPSIANIPSAKFQSPTNGATLKANTPFNITLQAKNIQLGKFTNAAKTYFSNPQTLNAQGQIIGHTHIVIEAVDSLDTTKVSDATKFLFFKGINDAADSKGNVQAVVAAGLPAGTYRMGTIMSSATHQVISPTFYSAPHLHLLASL